LEARNLIETRGGKRKKTGEGPSRFEKTEDERFADKKV